MKKGYNKKEQKLTLIYLQQWPREELYKEIILKKNDVYILHRMYIALSGGELQSCAFII